MSRDNTPRTPKLPGPGPLTELLTHLVEQSPQKYRLPAHDGHSIDTREPQRSESAAAHPASITLLGEPPDVEYFQQTWSRLSTGLRVRQSQQQVPENAGPLNSSQLIHRSLVLMQERSPGYLRHFLTYVETLSWMEPLNDSLLPSSAAPASRSAAPKKAAGKAAAKTTRRPARRP